ncbi:hypothetical protein M5689_010703 [Euphorbia peplus]|nr:hypothetical protein M5689_010703 [Euphorbia peplus]
MAAEDQDNHNHDNPEAEANEGSSFSLALSNDQDLYHEEQMDTPDVNNTALKLERASSMHGQDHHDHDDLDDDDDGDGVNPTKGEVWGWYLYELCSYFIQNTLIPVLFPLIISQILKLPPTPPRGWGYSHKGLVCSQKQMKLYESVIHKSISIDNAKFSPLEWTSLSWGIGLFLAAPVLAFISLHLDYGRNQVLITTASIAIGALFCLPAGFFNVTWIIPPYIAAIVITSTIASASHTRQLALMVQSFTSKTIKKSVFPTRRSVSSWLSLYATAAGGLGSAIISTFIYHMLENGETFVRLWIVSIFSGLKWLVGISHVIFVKPGETYTSSTSYTSHFLSIFKYPHALGTLVLTFLSSFTTMCIFTSAILHMIGELCYKPLFVLICWLIYFLFPIISLPLMHLFQRSIKANGVKMHLLGFYLSIATTVVGFYFRGKVWDKGYILFLTAVQSTSVGVLHSYGRILLIDCSPKGKEGVFSGWFSWSRAVGACLGYAVASALPGNASTAFGIAFITSISGTLLLNYGNISDVRGAMAAKLVRNGGVNDADDKRFGTAIKREDAEEKSFA